MEIPVRRDVIMIRRVYGDDAATASVARSLLAPVANQLSGSGDTPDLHRRLVLVHLRSLKGPEDVRAAFDGVEAVAICILLMRAVVVFETEAGAARALQEPAKEAIGPCTAVPSLDLAAGCHFIPYKIIKVSAPAGASGAPPPPEPSMEDRARAFQEMCELKPMIDYDGPAEWKTCRPGMTTITQFAPSADSLVHGPTLGGGGYLWMHGSMVTYYHAEAGKPSGSEFNNVSIRVKQEETHSTKIRVTPLEPLVYVNQFGHLFCVTPTAGPR
ncbi:uncharacterized protein [Triticum aestivum]|uniref:uncharacterized protein n=1 Tax=Triticum aestivum TaxID=4565 RepID=UPI001D0130CB|nr:uncharacterized protein LOC123184961 [Triticum aestivum]